MTLIDREQGVIAQRSSGAKLTDVAFENGTLAVGWRDGFLYGLAPDDLRPRCSGTCPAKATETHPPIRIASTPAKESFGPATFYWLELDPTGNVMQKKPVDMSGDFSVLPDGHLVTGSFKGVFFITTQGKIHLVPTPEWNPRIPGVDTVRSPIYASRWGQGQLWQVMDFERHVVSEASLGNAQ